MDDTTKQRIIELWDNGATNKEIGEATGVKPSSVSRAIQQLSEHHSGGGAKRRIDKATAISLRLKERLTLDQIIAKLDNQYARSTIFGWIKEYPLTDEELSKRLEIRKLPPKRTLQLEKDSTLYKLANGRELSRNEKGLISEHAILMRLIAAGFIVMKPDSSQCIFDLLVFIKDENKYLKIQIKTARDAKWGQPYCSLKHTGPRKNGKITMIRYGKNDFDILVGYDWKTDSAYVFTEKEVEHLATAVSCKPEALERWDKLRQNDPIMEKQGFEP